MFSTGEKCLFGCFLLWKMSSDDEMSSVISLSSDAESLALEEEEGEVSFNAMVQPYQDEPIVDIENEEHATEDDEDDEDRISFATLESRFEDKESVRNW